MEVKYNYKPYATPKTALYYETGNDYIKDPVTGLFGWSKVQREALIIGEDDTCFITELRKSRNCDAGDTDYGKVYLLPIGFHKSRFINWVKMQGQQLELFG